MKNKTNKESDTWARYERLRELGIFNYGQITAKKVIGFMSDPVLSDAGKKMLISLPVKHMYGAERPIVSQAMASTFSAVFVPADGVAYIAMGAEPAQAGTYWPINLREHLDLMGAFVEQDVYRFCLENASAPIPGPQVSFNADYRDLVDQAAVIMRALSVLVNREETE